MISYQQRYVGLLKDILYHVILDRIDAWGIAYIVAGLMLVLHDQVTYHNLVLLGAITVGYAIAYGLNDYHDCDLDAADANKAKRNIFVQYPISDKMLRRFFIVVTIALVGIFASYGIRGWLILAVCYSVMWSYTAPPLRIKSRPGWDLLVHGLFVQSFPLVIVLVLNQIQWNDTDVMLLLINICASLMGQLNQQKRDFHADQAVDTNFTQQVGLQVTSQLILTLIVMIAILLIGSTIFEIIPLYISQIYLLGIPHLLSPFLPSNLFSSRAKRISLTYIPTICVILYVTSLLAQN